MNRFPFLRINRFPFLRINRFPFMVEIPFAGFSTMTITKFASPNLSWTGKPTIDHIDNRSDVTF